MIQELLVLIAAVVLLVCCQAYSIYTGWHIMPNQAADTVSTNWMAAVKATLPAKRFTRAASINRRRGK